MSELVSAREKHSEVYDLLDCLNRYETIPSSFDDRTPEEFFGEIDPPKIGEKYLIPNGEDGIVAELVSAQVLEQEKTVWGHFKTNDSFLMAKFQLTVAEFTAYKRSPETFFGKLQTVPHEITEPHQCYDFLFSTYKNSSKQSLLEFMKDHADIEELKKMDQPILAKLYCERMGTAMWQQGQSRNKTN